MICIYMFLIALNPSISQPWYSAQESLVLKNETLIRSGFLVATLKSVSKEYMVSLEVKPTLFDNTTYRHILQLTANGSISNYGDRNPLIYFTKVTGLLVVSSAINGNKNYIFTIKTLSLNEWTSVKVVQQLVNGSYNFSVAINGSVVTSVINLQPIEFSNAKVYASGPWDTVQSGFIRNLIVLSGTYEFWSQWSQWSSCNESCTAFRSRNCSNSQMFNCLGNISEIESCNNLNQVSWTQWSNWSSCNVSYEKGFMNRTRMCNESNDLCCGNRYELEECFDFWTPWSAWSECIPSCDTGMISRTRVCNNTKSLFICPGNSTETMSCINNITCSDSWTQWSSWSECLSLCDAGMISRTRVCNNTNSFFNCSGNSTETMSCVNNITCPDLWTQWSAWSECIPSCGTGMINRMRVCNSSNSLLNCSGNSTEVITCISNKTCLEEWSPWSECSATCGEGKKSSYTFGAVKDIAKKVESCNVVNCPVDGMWGNWIGTECSKNCDGGVITFNRSCDNPAPKHYGQDCMGISSYVEECPNNGICSVNGGWSNWSEWSLCNYPCEGGVKVRFRNCSNPTPKNNGLFCYGANTEAADCPWKKCSVAELNLAISITGEYYIEPYSDLNSYPSLDLKSRIEEAVTKLYKNLKSKVGFNVMIHSIKEQDG
ncbi:A disintegrin and metalloproteinase with thrombospondin motifs adt-1-like isoform X2 [Hydra vulgaris]|uniref:A disintegrin and metalloproteinase with thrombospondin motifs adt-1-like isoform X2 n=1 Tax=Hydra vulgaris TaxID=6087 RepID=A0ABM4BWX2_HYDVU